MKKIWKKLHNQFHAMKKSSQINRTVRLIHDDLCECQMMKMIYELEKKSFEMIGSCQHLFQDLRTVLTVLKAVIDVERMEIMQVYR